MGLQIKDYTVVYHNDYNNYPEPKVLNSPIRSKKILFCNCAKSFFCLVLPVFIYQYRRLGPPFSVCVFIRRQCKQWHANM